MGGGMKIANEVHESGGWRIRAIAPDFTVEDVWALPARGDANDFPELLSLARSLDPANADSGPTRLLWRLRDLLGRWCDLGTISEPTGGGRSASDALPIPGTSETSLRGRLPEDLRGTADDV